jgi:hypothetical protein
MGKELEQTLHAKGLRNGQRAYENTLTSSR